MSIVTAWYKLVTKRVAGGHASQLTARKSIVMKKKYSRMAQANMKVIVL